MNKTSRIFLILIILIQLVTKDCLATEATGFGTVFLGNRKLSPLVRYTMQKQGLYLNHCLLEETFKIKVKWETGEDCIQINLDNFRIGFQVKSSVLTINGKSFELDHPLFEQEDNLWFPLEFYEILGITKAGRKDDQLKLIWKENYLLSLVSTQYQGRPALEFELTRTDGFKHYLLTNPDRLVCQFPATKVHPLTNSRMNGFQNDLVKKGRFNQDDTGLLTLVLDLTASPGYQIIPDPNYRERILLVFNYFLEDLSLFHKGEELKVNIETSALPDFKVVHNKDRSLIIDFDGAVLRTSRKNIVGDGELIKEIVVEQIHADRVRLRLSLLKDEELFITQVPENPKILQIRKVQSVTGIAWTSSKQGSQLMISGDGELLVQVQKVSDAKRIQVDLNYARFHPDLTIPELSGDQGKTVTLKTISPNQVRVEIDLHYFLGFESELSRNKRQLRISFKPSPLVNKTFVIDPGHGGLDNGAVGKRGTLEKELNLEVSLRLTQLLETAGANVVLTRFSDDFISLYERAFLANFVMADYFISIHTNSHPKSKTQGVEVFYYPNHSKAKPLAFKILEAMVRETGLKKLAVKTNNFAVIRETQMPGVLLELGFISNPQEEQVLRSEDFKTDAAQGIFRGILDFHQ